MFSRGLHPRRVHNMPISTVDSAQVLERLLQETKDTDTKVLIAFLADWCGSCQAFKPTFERFATEHVEKIDKVQVAYIDVTVETDSVKKLADKFNVERLPTLVVFERNEKGYSARKREGAVNLIGLKRFVWPPGST